MLDRRDRSRISAGMMWEAREKTFLQNALHELKGVWRNALADRRLAMRDFSRLALGGWRRRERFTRLVALTKPKTPGFAPDGQVRDLVRQLHETGYTQPIPLLSPAQMVEIRDHLMAQPYSDPYRTHLGSFRYPEVPSPDSNQAYYSNETLLATPHLLALANHPLVLQTAEAILGCKPLLENLLCGWYFTDRAMEKGVQRFHRDFDTPRFIKLFLYLTDVDERSGPHVYVPGSQRSDKLLLRRYIGDDEVDAAFGPENVHRVCGPAGTCFLVDTFGVHKGGLPIDRPRFIFSAQYNVWGSPFVPGRPIHPGGAHPHDRYINQAYFGLEPSQP
jgi:hypothetical protein